MENYHPITEMFVSPAKKALSIGKDILHENTIGAVKGIVTHTRDAMGSLLMGGVRTTGKILGSLPFVPHLGA